MSKIIGFMRYEKTNGKSIWHYVREYRTGRRRTACGQFCTPGTNTEGSMPKDGALCRMCEQHIKDLSGDWIFFRTEAK